jgi:quercetin dioxygenase-like cupin family protein
MMNTGDTLNVLGDQVTLLAAGRDTGGTMTAVQVVAGPGSGPPPHTHVYAEIFYVLDGTLTVEVDGEAWPVRAGELAAVPGGAVHTYRNEAGERARFLAVLHPAGHEHFFAELGVPLDAPAPAGPPDVAHVMSVAARHGIEFAIRA